MQSRDLNISGTLFTLPGGDVKLAFGGSDRNEEAGINNTAFGDPFRGFKRNVLAEFGELYVPVIGDANAIPFVKQLTLSAAIRHDHYSDVGSTTNPKLGVLWTPVDNLDFRGTWGTAFRAPSAGELLIQGLGAGVAYLYNYDVENSSGTGVVPVFIEQAYNKPLEPEKAKTWTVGFDYKPSFLSGAKFSMDYYNVDYRNRIILPPFDTDMLEHPNIYGSLLTSFANDAAAEAYLNNFKSKPNDVFLNLENLSGGYTGVRYVYNDSQQNAAVSQQAGFDVQGEYAFAVADNDFDARTNIAVIDHINTQFSATSTPLNEVNTYTNPPKFRMRDELTWSRDEWRVNGALNFTNGYTDTSASPYGTVGSHTTFDLNVRYSPHFIEGLSGTISVINLFNTDPPYVHGGVGFSGIHYDVGNASPMGRFISFEIQKVW
jgi:outer membrane receptor protein involved in Fe transport